MKYEIVLTPDANQDITETFLWYESQSIGLGKNFLAQVDNSLKIIQNNHELYSIKYRDVRRCLIKRFPYKIFYKVNKDQIIVLAVIFGGRDPNWIKKRILKK